MTLGESFAFILDRDLGRLADQLGAYPSEEAIWRVREGTLNSAGTLALHLVGNLEYYIGSLLGGTGYIRDRDAEFGDRDVPLGEILGKVEQCRATMRSVLASLPDETFLAPFPEESPRGLGDESAHKFILHLAAHFSWHLGQLDYHRRIEG